MIYKYGLLIEEEVIEWDYYVSASHQTRLS